MDPQLLEYRRLQAQRHATSRPGQLLSSSTAGTASASASNHQATSSSTANKTSTTTTSTTPADEVAVPRTALDIFRDAEAPRNTIRVLTWNIDGLDTENNDVIHRTVEGVVSTIVDKAPSIVLLQEVIEPTLKTIQRFLFPIYEIYAPATPKMPYFSAILLQKGRVKQLGKEVNGKQEISALIPQSAASDRVLKRLDFATSRMGRELLYMDDISIDGHALYISTAHLESQKDSAAERKRQLEQSLGTLRTSVVPGEMNNGASCSSVPSSNPVLSLFGGDLNLRDAEAKEILSKFNKPPAAKKNARGGTAAARPTSALQQQQLHPPGPPLLDAWETAPNKSDDNKFTWDLQRNDNVKMANAAFVPRCRFDRVYYCFGRDHADAAAAPKLTNFQLVGTKRIDGNKRFPSDHFGLLMEFKLPATATSVEEMQQKASVGVHQNQSGMIGGPGFYPQQREAVRARTERTSAASVHRLPGTTAALDGSGQRKVVVEKNQHQLERVAVAVEEPVAAAAPDPDLVNAFVACLRRNAPEAVRAQMSTSTAERATGSSASGVGSGAAAAAAMGATSSSSAGGPVTNIPKADHVNRHKSPFLQLSAKRKRDRETQDQELEELQVAIAISQSYQQQEPAATANPGGAAPPEKREVKPTAGLQPGNVKPISGDRTTATTSTTAASNLQTTVGANAPAGATNNNPAAKKRRDSDDANIIVLSSDSE
ncbi:unnamed protein product [Amoebophrya sp. A120]|nr:unnamed protein product [Amoebophrya sp. A120]|eukprot:GSA120T00013423001.1